MEKSTDQYHKCQTRKGGLSAICKSCSSEYSRQRRITHRVQIAAQKKKYYAENKEKLYAQKKKYYAENRDKINAWRRKYNAKNRDKINTQVRLQKKKNRLAVIITKPKKQQKPAGKLCTNCGGVTTYKDTEIYNVIKREYTCANCD